MLLENYNSCYQCNTCKIRMGDRSRHDKSHVIHQIQERSEIKLFPPSIVVGVQNVLDGLSLPNTEIVDQWVRHQKGLVEDGDVSSRWDVSSSQKSFLCQIIEATNQFTYTEGLAIFTRSYYHNGSVSRTTLINYLGSFDKFVKYLKNHKPALFPGLKQVDWHYVK